jgi:hypothetical protein
MQMMQASRCGVGHRASDTVELSKVQISWAEMSTWPQSTPWRSQGGVGVGAGVPGLPKDTIATGMYVVDAMNVMIGPMPGFCDTLRRSVVRPGPRRFRHSASARG